MGIIGCINWNNREKAFYTQEIRSSEHLLNTCAPTAALNCITSVGHEVNFETRGGYSPRPDEVLSSWFNDPSNFSRMYHVWSGLKPKDQLGNDVAQWYPLGVEEVFGVRCEYFHDLSPDEIINHLLHHRAVQVCLRKPSHYLALVAWDDTAKEFIIKDSWEGRWKDRNGFCKRMTLQELQFNTRTKFLVYYPGRLYEEIA